MDTGGDHHGMISVYLSSGDTVRDHTLSIDDILDHERVVSAEIHRDGVIYLDWSSTYKRLGLTFWLLWRDVDGGRVEWVGESDTDEASSMLVLLHESIGDD